LYYSPDPSLSIPPLSDTPSSDHIEIALELIHQAIGEFPYADEASYANAIAAMLTPIIKPAIEAPAPLAIVHPETPRVPYTPGWDLVGTVDQLGADVTGFELRQTVAAMPIHGCYAQYVCVHQGKLVPVPWGIRRCRGGRRGVELHHRVSDAASNSQGPARTAYVDPRGLRWRRLRNVAVGKAGRRRDEVTLGGSFY
jgi:hypothetical protein